MQPLVSILIPAYSPQFFPQALASALFDGLEPLLQVAHLGVERVVAHPEALVGRCLRGDLPVQLAHAQPPSLAEPERILERQYQAGEDGGECLHFSWWKAPRPA